jgi:hypothetical protein
MMSEAGGIIAVMATPPEPAGLAALLADRPPAVAALLRRLRTVALTALPDLTERVLPGWQALALHHPVGGYIAGLFPRADDVAIYLEHGAALRDPHALLTGSGKRTRMLICTPTGTDPTDEQFVDYLDLAVDHALSR